MLLLSRLNEHRGACLDHRHAIITWILPPFGRQNDGFFELPHSRFALRSK
jgi:hypothetical protein